MVHRTTINALICAYLFLTFSALVYTVFRVHIIPKPIVHFFYGMMAPFQGYDPMNSELSAEGLRAGEWEDIDLRYYIPTGRGEITFRGYQMMLQGKQHLLPSRYALQAQQLHEKERERGNEFETIRLYWREWPKSPAGFYYLNHDPFVEKELLAEAP